MMLIPLYPYFTRIKQPRDRPESPGEPQVFVEIGLFVLMLNSLN